MGFIGDWRRKRAIDKIRIGEEQWRRVEARLPFLGHLTPAERQQLRELARAFVATKEWSGARGFVLTADVQLAVALQACLLVLKLGLDWYRGWLGVVVYPGDFVIPRQTMDEAGVVHEYDDEVLGEAWEGGPVLVSWCDAGATHDGINVVIHEFAHKLDMRNGAVDGLPALHEGMSRRDWSAAFEPAFDDFRRRVDRGEKTRLDPYAAEHPAEFFAVMSEAFFQTPALLRDEYPQVYDQLRLFYRQDPATTA
ncbi:MAG: zinc-dependent peptidase [Rhodocyclaceae bacterium]|nr:zinc-dependent peptidase [Rhodocyclaceae bacterium]